MSNSEIDSQSRPESDAPARILALMVAADGAVDAREVAALDRLGAFERIGIPRERFVALADECLRGIAAGLGECSWLRERDEAVLDALLDTVTDQPLQHELCRLAAAVLTADGRVGVDERLVYEHVLARWRISRPLAG